VQRINVKIWSALRDNSPDILGIFLSVEQSSSFYAIGANNCGIYKSLTRTRSQQAAHGYDIQLAMSGGMFRALMEGISWGNLSGGKYVRG